MRREVGIFVSLDLVLYKRLVNSCLLLNKLETWSKVRAILMFGSTMELGISMSTRLRSLKTYITQNWIEWILVWPICFIYCFSHIGFLDAPTFF